MTPSGKPGDVVGNYASNQLDDALARSIQLGECGIQVAVIVGDDLVARAIAGYADDGGTTVYDRTMFPIFSFR